MPLQIRKILGSTVAICTISMVMVLQIGNEYLPAATVEFTATVPNAPGMRTWPATIVTFTDRTILPVEHLCGADCDGLTVARDGEPARYELVRIRGEGPAAIVGIHEDNSNFVVCNRGRGCMRFEVRRESP